MLLWCWQTCSLFSFTLILSLLLQLLLLSLPPSHFALASGILLVMESHVSLCEPLSLMRLLSHHRIKLTGCTKLLQHKPTSQAPGRPSTSPHCTDDRTLWLIRWNSNKESRAGDTGQNRVYIERVKLKKNTSVFFLEGWISAFPKRNYPFDRISNEEKRS